MKNSKTYLFLNIFFVFIFLNVWDFAINRSFFNGMILGVVMLAPVCFLWFIARFKAVVLLTLISLFEFMVMLIFVWEGFELNGFSATVKSVFWIPFLVAAGVNTFWGLSIYSKSTKKSQLV